ncbi:MAG: DNA repair protein RecO, partial [Bacilli bacterium]|nr:DNA repair protein RecO [Bacilli bacterium]
MAPRTTINIQGYPYRITQYKEQDAMVNVLTDHGEYAFLAHGIYKTTSKNASAVQLLSLGTFTLYERKDGTYSLKEGVADMPADIRDNLDRSVAFSVLAELTSKCLVAAEDAEGIYLWLDTAARALDKGFDAPTATLLYFAHLLNELGMGPNVDSCVFCGSKEHIAGFSYVDGG